MNQKHKKSIWLFLQPFMCLGALALVILSTFILLYLAAVQSYNVVPAAGTVFLVVCTVLGILNIYQNGGSK